MCEAGIQIFHLGSDVIPAETGGCVSSGFAHGSREVEVGGQPADGRTEWLSVPRNDGGRPQIFRTISAAPTSG